MNFTADKISDQKRLARGEHLLLARTCLRQRDHVHHHPWRILMLAGPEPAGEIRAIRELMPKSYIVAVDEDPVCTSKAIASGADEGVNCDLLDWDMNTTGPHANAQIAALERFDLIDLDFCAGIDTTRSALSRYYARLIPGGVMMFTFSYGRDVAEIFLGEAEAFASELAIAKRQRRQKLQRFQQSLDDDREFAALTRIHAAQMPDYILGRVLFPLGRQTRRDLRSVIAYKGNKMPMIAMLLVKSRPGGLSFIQLEGGDFELAVVYPDTASLYDCPADRIDSLRRKFAAIKAVLTREKKHERTNGKAQTQDAG